MEFDKRKENEIEKSKGGIKVKGKVSYELVGPKQQSSIRTRVDHGKENTESVGQRKGK